ncbi:MAG TPA: M3 family oligoendopeptidase [Thermoflexia bacterium]|nr:M3 family oligoendopeptidase [Thermoflexia bacterium]
MVYKPQRWTLDELLPQPGTPEQEAYLVEVRERLHAFAAVRAELTPQLEAAAFMTILQQYETLAADASRLVAYAYLWFSEDTGDQDAMAFRSQIEQFTTELQNQTLFFDLWWKSLDDEAAERLLTPSGDLRYFLKSLRRFKPHTLSEPVEQAINIKEVNGLNAVLTIYDKITTNFTYQLTVAGEELELTRGELAVYVFSPDPALRAAAYQELYRVYEEHADVLAYIYAARVRDWHEENVKLREYESPVSVRNLGNDIPDEVVETLLVVVRDNVGLFQRYFRFKAEALGVEKLRRYDIYAPLTAADKDYTFDEAVQLVDAAYRAFSPRLADQAKQIIEEQHLDAEVRKQKLGGAYCYGVLPGVTPWVLTNFQGKINDVSTLAHELGHGVHALMAAEHSPLTFHSVLPLAETASVFGEMLLTDKLLSEEDDREVQRTLLNNLLSDAYATIARQAYFVLFEEKAHAMIKNGARPDDLYTAYLDNLREQFGDTVEVSEDFRLEWLAIPHIYQTPFYCYAYAFGNLLVLALYRKYKAVGREEFVPDYLRILAHGGSASPEQIISEAGFDMADPAFWQGAFDLLAEMMTELEELSE